MHKAKYSRNKGSMKSLDKAYRNIKMQNNKEYNLEMNRIKKLDGALNDYDKFIVENMEIYIENYIYDLAKRIFNKKYK